MANRDRWLLIGLAVLLVVLSLLSAAEPGNAARDPRRSSFLNSPGGTRALFLTLRELKLPADRRTAPFADADSIAGPLLVIAPDQRITPAELAATARWVRAGGTLFYAAAAPLPDRGLLDTLGLRVTSLGDSVSLARRLDWEGEVATARSHEWTAGQAPVPGFRAVFADSSPALHRPGRQVLLALRGGATTAVTYPMGRGQVIAFSDAQPLTNAALRNGGATVLVARAAAGALRPGQKLWFDEYHHGYSADGDPMDVLGGLLAHTRGGHALLQLTVAALGVLWLFGRRFGAPIPPRPAERRSPMEHVEALAGAYRMAGARGTARRLLVAGLARRLGRRAPTEAAEAALLDGLAARLPAGRDTARALAEEWNRGHNADLVALARYTDTLLDEVRKPS